LWLADANPTSTTLFGVEKDQRIDLTVYQQRAWEQLVPTGGSANLACGIVDATARPGHRRNAWGFEKFTHTGASTTLLGASAVIAALVSFF